MAIDFISEVVCKILTERVCWCQWGLLEFLESLHSCTVFLTSSKKLFLRGCPAFIFKVLVSSGATESSLDFIPVKIIINNITGCR